MPVKPVTLAVLGGGLVLVWSGLQGKSPLTVFKDLLTGVNPSKAPNTEAVTTDAFTSSYGYGNSGSSSTGVSATSINGPLGQEIATNAQSYVGKFPYVWGGAPANGGSDCSGFVNWVVGHNFGLGIPLYKAGKYNGSTHGPATTAWLVWPGCVTIARKDASAGDLAVWETHMGIFTDNNNMVSALNPSLGTMQTTISGGAPPGEILSVRRLKVVAGNNQS